MFDIMEYTTLNHLIKDMQKEGFKKVKHELHTEEINGGRIDKMTLMFRDEEEHNEVIIGAEVDVVEGYINIIKVNIEKIY